MRLARLHQQYNETLKAMYHYRTFDERKGEVWLVRVRASHLNSMYITCNLESHPLGQLIGNRTYEAISHLIRMG